MESSPIKSRLAGSHGRLYWRSLGELADTLEFREYLHREFPEQASEWNDPKGRRQFLKLMSASLALAGVGACTKQPTEQIVPYVKQPEDIVPGRPLFFASAIPLSGIAQPVLVESHMGRPTKIEGNPEHPASLGATDAITQGAILGLYDPDRAKTVTGSGEVQAYATFLTAVSSAASRQKAKAGAGLRFLSGPVTSPSLAELMATVLAAYPQAHWHQYDPISRGAARGHGSQAFAAGGDAIYHFDKADVVVSLDSDFLTCGPGSVRYQKDFAARRRVTDERKEMNRLYAIESTPSLTGVKADHRLALRAADIENFARELAGHVGAGPGGPAANPPASVPRPGEPEIAKWVTAIAKDLQNHKGTSVVIAGEYQPEAVHGLARAVNQALGNVGTTVTYDHQVAVGSTTQGGTLAELAQAMDSGQVEMLVILGGVNPVYTAPADLKFADKLAKVTLRIYHGLYADETAFLCHWHVPEAHPLESWGDARAHDGTVTLIQPLIAPLYDGRTVSEIVTAFTAKPDARSYAIVKDYWTRAFSGAGGWPIRDSDGQPFKTVDSFWRRALHDGFIPGTAFADGGPVTPFMPMSAAPAPAVGAPATGAAQPAAGTPTPGEQPAAGAPAPAAAQPAAAGAIPAPAPPASLTPPAVEAPSPASPISAPQSTPPPPATPGVEGGLELIFRPDPTVWDGRFANNGWLQELPKPLTKVTWDATAWVSPQLANEQRLRDGDVIEMTYRGNTARMPVFRVPGHPHQSITVFFGYGRKMAGHVGNATKESEAFNAFLLRTSDAPWFGNGLEIRKTGDNYPLATTQEHHLMEGRNPVRVATIEQYRNEPRVIEEQGETPPKTLTMYPEHPYDGNKWGMAIDLSACTGCNACTIACVAENNIPVVGKDQVARGREMHWIRVDHYFAGDEYDTAVEAYHQPVPCMQCENAPCELVCPVAATTHSSEGLNDMVYNRCVGTRYCSNNCPYKVRRFNFLLYQDWETQSLYPMRNPDVTVRSRGVMEKCTYCVQRINQARIDAKREDRAIRDGEVVPACAAVCPADAIVFGNLNDPNSRVVKLKAQERNYGVLEDLNTRPRTTYLAVLKNPNPELASAASHPTEH
jgi:molybdopterin-containing oxidoreductase family iron-sulfur binding subunit